MENNGFVEDGFIIDLSNAKDAAEIIYELSNILEMPEARDKKICLKLGNIDLTQSQLLSIKALIESMVSELAFVDTNSEKTELSALNLGIIVSELSNEIAVEEAEAEEAKIKEMEVGQPKDGLSYSLPAEEDEVVEKKIAAELEVFPAEKVEDVEVVEDKEVKAEVSEDLIVEVKPVVEPAPQVEEVVDREALLDELAKLPTLYLRQTLRSGQTMSYDGNIVLIGDANPGSEIIAKGDITVWGVIGGIAHAGARGNECSKIRALKLNAIQLRISGYYARRPDTVNIPFIQRSNEFTPEEARVNGREISIYKMYEN